MTRLQSVNRFGAVQGFFLAALALAGPLVVAGDVAVPGAPPSTPESVRAGEAVFFEYCSGCHGRRADGRGPESLNLDPRPQNLRNAQFVRHLSDDRMYTSISGGVRGTAMPAWELQLAAEKRWNVIHYIRSLTADDTVSVPNGIARQAVNPEVRNPLPADEANAAAGGRIFLSYCASCHGRKADGSGVLAPNLVPAPRNLVAITSWGERPFISYLADGRVYDSITNGVPGTSMQPWIGVLTDAERWQVVCYLRHEGDREMSARAGGGEGSR
ncbi:MAG TPA: c-type cytochrome [Bacteroidota bacterium]|nr:c-type cytochrome [Bacteroidota bacterium]